MAVEALLFFRIDGGISRGAGHDNIVSHVPHASMTNWQGVGRWQIICMVGID